MISCLLEHLIMTWGGGGCAKKFTYSNSNLYNPFIAIG